MHQTRTVRRTSPVFIAIYNSTASANHRYDKAVKQALKSDVVLLNKRIRDQHLSETRDIAHDED
jgi:hypothetical protein